MKDLSISNKVRPAEQTRRTFLQLATLGGGVSLLASLLPGGVTQAAGKTEALLLSCMDYRLTHHTEQYMSSRGLREQYDHIVLAGAALGAITNKYPAWNKTFWEHLDIAIQLHNIHRVIVLDHRDCGAYKVILGEDLAKDPAKEREVHATQLKKLARLIKERHPRLEIELLLMSLDGKVEKIT
ncbi:MAG TPA: carbonic anhydrase [Acidobacteriota bacterium]|nr:carbonic anhydrase [Acidobacteriota bacterium]